MKRICLLLTVGCLLMLSIRPSVAAKNVVAKSEKKLRFVANWGLGAELHVWTTHNSKKMKEPTFLALSVPTFVGEMGTEYFRGRMAILFTFGLTEFYFEPEIDFGVTYTPFGKYLGVQLGGTIGGLFLNHFSFRAYAKLYLDLPILNGKVTVWRKGKHSSSETESVPVVIFRLTAGYEARTSVLALNFIKDNPAFSMGAHGLVFGVQLTLSPNF